MSEAMCECCGGVGRTYAAMDMLARPPREQREYEQMVHDMGRIATCYVCHGTGRLPSPPKEPTP